MATPALPSAFFAYASGNFTADGRLSASRANHAERS